MLSGLPVTVALSLSAWVVALALGSLMGVLRTVPNRGLSGLAATYVEVFRNIPLLGAALHLVLRAPRAAPPSAWATPSSRTSTPSPSSSSRRCCASAFFTSARVCEQVRAGINALPRGQKNAGLALGFTLPQTYRHVLLPMAFRLVVPPLTSEFLNVFKNSAVCSTIGLLELAAQGRQARQLPRPSRMKSFIAVTVLYLVINVVVMTLMRVVENKTRVPGYLGGK